MYKYSDATIAGKIIFLYNVLDVYQFQIFDLVKEYK